MQLLAFLVAFAALAGLHGPALGQDAPAAYQLGPLAISQPWARATVPAAKVGAGYMRITNRGSEPERLVGFAAAIAGRGEVHEMSMDNGVMKMRQVKGGLVIAPGKTVELKPGGLHVMFIDLKEPLKEGEQVPATLSFEKAGDIDVSFQVKGIAAGSHNRH